MTGSEIPIFWRYFWTAVFIVGMVVFAGLSVVVSIGGLTDIISWLSSVEQTSDSATPTGSDSADTDEDP